GRESRDYRFGTGRLDGGDLRSPRQLAAARLRRSHYRGESSQGHLAARAACLDDGGGELSRPTGGQLPRVSPHRVAAGASTVLAAEGQAPAQPGNQWSRDDGIDAPAGGQFRHAGYHG